MTIEFIYNLSTDCIFEVEQIIDARVNNNNKRRLMKEKDEKRRRAIAVTATVKLS